MAKKYLGEWNGVPVYLDLLPFGTRRTGRKLDSGTPKFAVIHDTGNPNSTAQGNVNYYKDSYNVDWIATASAHIFVDDKECIVCIPLDEKAWHVLYDVTLDNLWYGDDANDIAFGIEYAYFSDRSRSLKSLDNGCRVMGALCKEYGIDVKTELPGHQDIQAGKIDPGNLLAACGYGRDDMHIIDNLILKYKGKQQPVEVVKAPAKKPVQAANKGTHTVKKGDTYYNIAIRYNLDVKKLMTWNNIEPDKLKVGDKIKLEAPAKPAVKFDAKKNRKRSASAYVKGKIDSAGAEVRKRSGSSEKGFNFNTKAGYDLNVGETVYIFEVFDGWGRIYTGNLIGKGSNDWIWLGRLQVNKVFK